MAGICEGDKEALSRLFRRYARLVRAVAFRVLRDPSEADDLVQDVFLSIHRKCKAYDSTKSPVRFWILQMTYRLAISRRRYLDARHFYKRIDLEVVGKEIPDPGSNVARYEDSIDGALGNGSMEKLLRELSENQRQTLRLHFFEGCTFDEIAVKLGQTRGNVKHHYFRGLDRLRGQIFGNGLRVKSAV